MEEACVALEREFKKVIMDLEYTNMTLEAEYDASDQQRPNIFQLVQKIQNIEIQLERIKSKSQLLVNKRHEISLSVTKQLLENYNQINLLMNQCQLESNSQYEDYKECVISSMEQNGFTELSTYRDQVTIANQPPPPVPPQWQSQSQSFTNNEISIENIDSCNQLNQSFHHDHISKSSKLPPTNNNIPPPPSSSSGPESDFPPRSRNQFDGTIPSEEFNSISSHIRGRCSLHDSQRLLTYLRSEYSKIASKSTTPTPTPTPMAMAMSIQQLDQLGYRVCGQTGLCMLKTLQKLGYVELTKRCDQVTLSSLGSQGIALKRRK